MKNIQDDKLLTLAQKFTVSNVAETFDMDAFFGELEEVLQRVSSYQRIDNRCNSLYQKN